MHIIDEIKNRERLRQENFISIPEISKITGLYAQTVRELILANKVPWGTYIKKERYAFVIKRKEFNHWWSDYLGKKEKVPCAVTQKGL